MNREQGLRQLPVRAANCSRVRWRRNNGDPAQLVVVCATLLFALAFVRPASGQTTPWNTNGSSIWYAPSGVSVGINTTTPGSKLDVAGMIRATDLGSIPTSGAGIEMFYNTGSSFGRITTIDRATTTYVPLRLNGLNIILNEASGGNVGIGTPAPAALLHVYGNSGNPKVTVEGGASAIFPLFQLIDDRTGGSNWNLENGREGGGILGFHNNTGPGTVMVITQPGNVGIGTTAPQYKLSVNGTIGTKEVIVTNTGWSDYVFKPDYLLRPLMEVASYIKANHHLPGIPTEAEVRENGVSLGEMQSKLLAKIEELTLHAIQEHERNDRLEQENQRMQERLARLEGRTTR